MKFKTILLTVFLLAFVSVFANNFAPAWGPTGHRTIGKIAERHLKKSAKRKIDKLLQGESLAFVSTYADEIKSDNKYRKFFPWHYVNMELEETYATAKKNPEGDLVTAINYCIKVLKDEKSSTQDKRFYLKMLVHFIGDLHQPLHIGRKEDKGGNTIQVQWFGKGTNLHRVWDENMLDQWDMSYLELANNAKKITKAQIKSIEKGSVEDWVNEVHNLTKEVYNSAKVGEKLSYRYNYLHFGTLREQLQKGGIRLAKILNDIFG